MSEARRRAMEKQRASGNDPASTRSTPEAKQDFNSWMYHTGPAHKEWLEQRKRGENPELKYEWL